MRIIGDRMSQEDLSIVNMARNLLREYDKEKVVSKNLLVRLLEVWNKLKKIECPSIPFSFEQIGECEIAEIRRQIADIILQKATKIAF